MDPERRCQVLRMAAAYVARKERGEPVHWCPIAWAARLDDQLRPTTERINVGPLILSGEHYSLPTCQPGVVHLNPDLPQPPSWDAVDRAYGRIP